MKNILRNKRTQIFLAVLIIFTFHLQIFTQSAFARGSGGGEMGKFDTGKFAVSVGVGLALMAVGNAMSSGMSGAYSSTAGTAGSAFADGFGSSIGTWGNVGTWANNYSSMFALSQVGAAVNTMGQQQDWGNSTTVMASSVVQGMTGGFLNPSSVLGAGAVSNTTIKAMTVGAISGVTEGVILANNIDSDGRINPWVSAGAGLVGSFVGGVASSSIAPVVPSKTGSYKDYVASGGITKDGQSFGPVNRDWYYQNKFSPATKASSFGEAFTHGAVKAFSAIPSSMVSMGVSSITKDMDRQDAFMVRQAFSGAYPIVGTAYGNVIRDPVFEKIGLQNYTGSNSLEGNAKIKIDNRVKMVPIPGN